MGLIEDELKQISQMHRDLVNGKISVDKVNTHIGLFSQTEKRMKLMLMASISSAKFSKSIMKKAVKSNLLGDGQAIDTTFTDHNTEKVKCPLMDDILIERQTCLDTSGDEKNHDVCLKCEHDLVTKHLLLPKG